MKNVHFDFETYCDLDLKASGVHRYVEHPSFQVLCVAWRVDNGPVTSSRMLGSLLPPVLHALLFEDIQGHAWNSAFERTILRRLGVVPARELSCTMQRALAYGLPAKLEKAAPALGMPHVKDMAGHKIMLRMSKPPGYRTATQEDWAGLLAYCEKDVMAESEIAKHVPDLSEEEELLSQIDAAMNDKGIWVDLAQVRTFKRIAEAAEKQEAAACTELTGGAVTSPGTQTARLTAWLQAQGLAIEDVARATMEAFLGDGVTPPEAIAEVMRIRLRTARASTKKLGTILAMASSGDRLRGQFQFLGAARTGRWAGRGIQPQNLPRVQPGFSPRWFMQAIARPEDFKLDDLNAIAPAPVLDCIAWSLRSVLGEQSELLWSFDFSQIEARVLAWLAGQADVLEVFRSGEDVYLWAAAQFGSQNRQLGKVLILALGFGMGAAKLRDTAKKNYFVTMTMEEAERFKRGWRQRNHRIVEFWYEIEDAARKAILQRGERWFPCGNGIALRASARTLQMRLPSGRVLYYHNPQVEAGGEITYWGEEKGQWVRRRTWGGTLAENATQAVARDVMACAMIRVWQRISLTPLMTVHDELVYCHEPRMAPTLQALMLTAPDWAGGLPIAGEVKVMQRYGVLK